MTKASPEIWHHFGLSVRGAQHQRAGLPNQDHWDGKIVRGDDQGLVIAVADGHGSPRTCRSEKGAELAVGVACETLDEFVQHHRADPIPVIKAEAERRLALRIVETWRSQVSQHYASYTLTESELNLVGAEAGEPARNSLTAEGGFYLAYGTTILAAVVTPKFVICLQLGDGDIVVVPYHGREPLRPIPRDDQFIANETTSLCLEPAKAISACRVRFQFIQDSPPALILLASDGYSNSFSSEAGFERVASDLLDALRAEGQQAVEQQLPEWLSSASSAGSGDDVTVAVLWRDSPVHPAGS